MAITPFSSQNSITEANRTSGIWTSALQQPTTPLSNDKLITIVKLYLKDPIKLTPERESSEKCLQSPPSEFVSADSFIYSSRFGSLSLPSLKLTPELKKEYKDVFQKFFSLNGSEEEITNKTPHEVEDPRPRWGEIIDDAIERSPKSKLENLPKKQREKVLRTEWLNEEPLSGICAGLAIQLIVDLELGIENVTMNPSKEARYWERLLIPQMVEGMQLYRCEDPSELIKPHHYQFVYNLMIKMVEEKAHLTGKIDALHVPYEQIKEKIESQNGHTLICIEGPRESVAQSHMIYCNPESRKICDDGTMIDVPDEDDFVEFFDFYMEKEGHKNAENRFTLIPVEKTDGKTVRKPSMLDRAALSCEIAFDSIVSNARLSESSRIEYEIGAVPLDPM